MVPNLQANGPGGSRQRIEEQVRHLVQRAPEVFFVLETDSSIRYANSLVERVLGYRPEEIVGTRLSLYLDQEKPENASNGLASALEDLGGAPGLIELEMKHADGTWLHPEAIGANLLGDPRVAGIGLCARDVTEQKARQEEIARQAFCDPLTALPNRALFTNRLGQALARAARHMEPVVVLFLDLDDFKAVNDCFGHGAGDRLLIAVGRRLQSCLRSEDTVARLGGDEFVILVDSARDAGYVAERILEALQTPFTLKAHAISVTASIGIAESTSPQDRCEDLLRRADAAMYRVKRNGKAHSEPFRPGSPPARALELLEPESDPGRTADRGVFKADRAGERDVRG